MTALKRRDVDIVNRTVRVRGAYIEQANGQMTLGPTKSREGLRTVAIPDATVPHLFAHLTKYPKRDDNALVFTVVKGGPPRSLMARMSHGNERAALRYQHRANSADRAVADGLNALVQADQKRDGDDNDGLTWSRPAPQVTASTP